MKKVLDPKKVEAGSKKSNEPRLLGSIVEEMLHGNSPLAVGYRQYIASQENGEVEEQGWHPNTHLSVDLKTLLCSETAGKRNPHVFDGKYITVTRRDDGSLRLNFKELPKGANFNLERFALGVYNELCLALGGLIEEA